MINVTDSLWFKACYDVLQLEMQIWTHGSPMNCVFINSTLQEIWCAVSNSIRFITNQLIIVINVEP